MAAMGDGIGEAAVLLAITLLLLLFASAFNAIGFYLTGKPRTGWRKIELAVFQIPLLLIVYLAGSFVLRFS